MKHEPDPDASFPEDTLVSLRSGMESGETTRVELDRIGDLMKRLGDPGRVATPGGSRLPWSAESRAVRAAEKASLEARLEVFNDDLKAIRAANRILNRISMAHAVEAARAAIFEIRSRGELIRYEILNDAQMEMTRMFVNQLENIEGMRPRLPGEMIDAMKERALNEFTGKMNRLSRAEAALSKLDPSRLRE